ncbi:MAG: hypothetical protein ACQEQZ_00930 [Pseudomonadota bacterium]
MQARWHKQQLAVLQAMNIPVYQHRPRDMASLRSVSECYCYRLGPIMISAEQPLPVQLPQWLEDCCTLFGSRPVAVKPDHDVTVGYDFEQCQQQMLSAAGKQSFWQQLGKHL